MQPKFILFQSSKHESYSAGKVWAKYTNKSVQVEYTEKPTYIVKDDGHGLMSQSLCVGIK